MPGVSSIEGVYDLAEDNHIRDAIRAFREVCIALIPNTSSYHEQTENINKDDILEYIWGKHDKDKDIGFWQHLGE